MLLQSLEKKKRVRPSNLAYDTSPPFICFVMVLTKILPDEALLLQSQVAKLDRPQKRALKVARAWMNDERRNKKGEKRATVLGGEARHYLDKKQDLLSLGGPTKKDPLSSFLQKHFPTWVSSQLLSFYVSLLILIRELNQKLMDIGLDM